MQLKESVKKFRPKRSTDLARRELVQRFGFSTKAGLKIALNNGDLELAEEFIEIIEKDPGNYPQFLDNFRLWVESTKSEIERYRKRRGY